jgi:phosphoglycerol transferase MdoB-like AlkP superfamily enzyme
MPDSSEVDIIFLQKPYHVTTSDSLAGKGTGHGTPYAYDREVPVLIGGPGVAHVRRAEPVDQLQVAPTLAALLGIDPPPAAARPSLVGTTPERARPEAVSAPPARGR